MTSPDPVLAPVAAHERIQALDVVRGFALLGIFLMNVEFFSRPMQDIAAPGIDPAMAGLDGAMDAFVFFFVQSKFWTLFSLLFGMGFAVMIERARRADRPFVPAYLRRSLALLGIGAVHALLIWAGDILVSYAIGALLLLGLRGIRHATASGAGGLSPAPMRPRALAAIGATLYALPLAAMLLFGMVGSLLPTEAASADAKPAEATSEHSDPRAERDAIRADAVAAYSRGSYADATRQRVVDTAEQLSLGNLMFFQTILLGVFLIGMAILRSGIAERPHEHLGVLRLMRNVGLPIGFAIMAGSTWLGTGMDFHEFRLPQALQVAGYLAAGLVLALAYGATLVLALEGRAGAWLRAWLGPAGRMALTNYLTQSLVGTLVFYGYGLGQWGRIGRAEQVLLVVVVFFLQLLLSRWWLARFRFGPAEWLWRALTYAQLPPMRREATA